MSATVHPTTCMACAAWEALAIVLNNLFLLALAMALTLLALPIVLRWIERQLDAIDRILRTGHLGDVGRESSDVAAGSV